MRTNLSDHYDEGEKNKSRETDPSGAVRESEKKRANPKSRAMRRVNIIYYAPRDIERNSRRGVRCGKVGRTAISHGKSSRQCRRIRSNEWAKNQL